MKLMLRATATLAGTLVAVAIAAACTSSTDATTIPPLTELYVDPASFLTGPMPPLCGAGEGSLQSYVATLQDVTYDPAAGVDWVDAGVVDLPSAPPTRCSLRAAFGQVISGHMYVGEVEAYDRPICAKGQTTGACLQPIGGQNSGSRTMVDLDGNPVAPRWRTRCGDTTHRQADGGIPLGVISDAPTFASFELQLPMNGCAPLESLGDEKAALLRVDAQSLLQSLGCSAGTGIEKLVGTIRQTGETATSNVTMTASGCMAPPLLFGGTTGLTPETKLDVDVLAFVAGTGLPTLGTTCSATTHVSATVTAPCGPLTSDGILRVDVPALLAARKLSCADVSLVKVSFVGASGRTASAACPMNIDFGGVPAGIYTLIAQPFTGDPAMEMTAVGLPTTCTATVSAGILTTATCD